MCHFRQVCESPVKSISLSAVTRIIYFHSNSIDALCSSFFLHSLNHIEFSPLLCSHSCCFNHSEVNGFNLLFILNIYSQLVILLRFHLHCIRGFCSCLGCKNKEVMRRRNRAGGHTHKLKPRNKEKLNC